MSTLDEDTVLQNLMNTILFVAMEDGKITDDEKAILQQVKLDINSLRHMIKKAEEAEDTSDKEAKTLKQFRKNLLQNAYDISRKDKVITPDERRIIDCLIKSLMKD